MRARSKRGFVFRIHGAFREMDCLFADEGCFAEELALLADFLVADLELQCGGLLGGVVLGLC